MRVAACLVGKDGKIPERHVQILPAMLCFPFALRTSGIFFFFFLPPHLISRFVRPDLLVTNRTGSTLVPFSSFS